MSDMNGTIAGTVTAAEDGAPLAGARVSAQGTIYFAGTDAQGRYSLTIMPGAYTMEATTIGRESQRKHVSVTIGGTTTANFVLEASRVFIEGPIVGPGDR